MSMTPAPLGTSHEWNHTVFVLLCLAVSLNVKSSGLIHVGAGVRTSFCFKAEKFPIVWTDACCPSSILGTWVTSTSGRHSQCRMEKVPREFLGGRRNWNWTLQAKQDSLGTEPRKGGPGGGRSLRLGASPWEGGRGTSPHGQAAGLAHKRLSPRKCVEIILTIQKPIPNVATALNYASILKIHAAYLLETVCCF